MKLTKEQIQELYQFVAAKGVKHYDLQTELVDHLANGIEEYWKIHPEKSFEEVKAQEFQKFGAAGFSDVIKKHDDALSKKYKKIISGFFMEYFKLPKIIGTITSIAIIFYCLRFLAREPFVTSIFTVMVFFFIIAATHVLSTLNNKIIYKRKVKKSGKQWKLEDMIFHSYIGYEKQQRSTKRKIFDFIIIIIPVTIGTLIDDVSSSIVPPFIYNHYWVQLVIATTIVLVSILTYIHIIVVPEKAEELLTETYPEYELLK
ncbi:hypothetical protein [uncultured Kordia sp.]|uniref:hypothetical protein n=1 Tax=uncultured Kordia sp. TaxID=507699 RepID=UPI00263794C5|nr:hypothetical protein [uncultured Kordia sp.]